MVSESLTLPGYEDSSTEKQFKGIPSEWQSHAEWKDVASVVYKAPNTQHRIFNTDGI